jgi:hypothetical protein
MLEDDNQSEEEEQQDYQDSDYEEKDMPETHIEFLTKLIEPGTSFQQIKRDLGLTNLKGEHEELIELWFDIARRAKHMALIADMRNFEEMARAMNALYNSYIEKIYEKVNTRRSSEGGFQWEALNKQIKEIRKKEVEKKRRLWMKKEENLP